MTPFKIETHDALDKSFQIEGPGDLTLHVDYDDVNRDEVDALARELVNVMNHHYAIKQGTP